MFRIVRNIAILQPWWSVSQRETVLEASDTEENIYLQLSGLSEE